MCEPISARQAIGIATSLAGVLAIVAQGELERLLHLKLNPGDILILSALLAWLFLGESLFWYHYVGAVLIFAGLYIASRAGALR